MMWLALPWRFVSRLVIGIGLATVGRRQPLQLLAVVGMAGIVVAVVQAVQQRQWAVSVVLSAVVVCPLVDAAVSRRSERDGGPAACRDRQLGCPANESPTGTSDGRGCDASRSSGGPRTGLDG